MAPNHINFDVMQLFRVVYKQNHIKPQQQKSNKKKTICYIDACTCFAVGSHTSNLFWCREMLCGPVSLHVHWIVRVAAGRLKREYIWNKKKWETAVIFVIVSTDHISRTIFTSLSKCTYLLLTSSEFLHWQSQKESNMHPKSIS